MRASPRPWTQAVRSGRRQPDRPRSHRGLSGDQPWPAAAASADTLAEDTDIATALCRAGWRVVYRSDAHVHTHVPTTIPDLWHQRYRWAYGTLQSIWKHRQAIKETGIAGHLGCRTSPYLLLFQLVLPLAAPLVDAAALYGLASGTTPAPAYTWALFSPAQLALAAYALRTDNESLRHLWLVPLQQIIYRTALCLVTIHAPVAAALGASPRWRNPSPTHAEVLGSTRPPSNAVSAHSEVQGPSLCAGSCVDALTRSGVRGGAATPWTTRWS
ncbi:glycosyltransferase family 2 protein [Streptomyces sp. NBC_01310]|uniref:glycosyltransferase n=1 Tax=Streptomyces sp. NBC_01310 TaxID=2903820 RepID=UPI0035B6AB69|nr:glycosyltransferase family 2 protein [Streptomyces sp. NBC_01310]